MKKKISFFSKKNKPNSLPTPNPQNKQKKQNQNQTITQTTTNSTSHNLVDSVYCFETLIYIHSLKVKGTPRRGNHWIEGEDTLTSFSKCSVF